MAEPGAQAEPEESQGYATRAAGALERIASLNRYHFGQIVYFQDQHADHWYRIVSGAARECVLTSDGRRQVVDFLFPGDLFGFSGQGVRGLAGEIIADATVLACYPRRRAESLADSDPQVARQLRELAFAVIERLQARTVLLGRNTALEKVSAFLLEMATRSATESGELIALPMTRYDIADYLALAVETVSRSLTALRARRAIELLGARCVQILDRELLFKLGATAIAMGRYRRAAEQLRVAQHRGAWEPPIDAHQRASVRMRQDCVPSEKPIVTGWRREL